MQPLKTSASPNSGSTIGWLPRSDRSMILRRRCPRATGPLANTPLASGPRRVIEQVMSSTAATSAALPSKRISPQIPHMTHSLSLRHSLGEGFRSTLGGSPRPGRPSRVRSGAAARHFGVTQVVMSQCTTSTPCVSWMATDTVTSVPSVMASKSMGSASRASAVSRVVALVR